mgnify:FL=1
MMLFPNPIRKSEVCKSENLLLVKECHCQNGHSLISPQAIFNGFPGILIRVSRKDKTGLVALSPVYGYKSRVSLDVELKGGQIWKIHCPDCGEELPKYSDCSCGAHLTCMFLDQTSDFSNCILICNRIDCFNAEIKYRNELVHYSSLDEQI